MNADPPTVSLSTKVTLAVFPAITIVVTLSYFSWAQSASDFNDFALSETIIILGITLGWVFGIFISPLGGKKEDFSRYGRAVSVFFSGYLVAKVDPLISKLLSAQSDLSSLTIFRLFAFAASFVVAMLIAFGWRKYL